MTERPDAGRRRTIDEIVRRISASEPLELIPPPTVSRSRAADRPSGYALPVRYRLATALKALRTRRGISQVELARRSKLTSGYVSKLENAKGQTPPFSTLERLARVLEIDVVELYSKVGLVDDDLLDFLRDNTTLLELIQEARRFKPSPETVGRMLSVLYDDARLKRSEKAVHADLEFERGSDECEGPQYDISRLRDNRWKC